MEEIINAILSIILAGAGDDGGAEGGGSGF